MKYVYIVICLALSTASINLRAAESSSSKRPASHAPLASSTAGSLIKDVKMHGAPSKHYDAHAKLDNMKRRFHDLKSSYDKSQKKR